MDSSRQRALAATVALPCSGRGEASPAFVRSHSGLLSILQALAYGVYSRDTSQYDERIGAFKLK